MEAVRTVYRRSAEEDDFLAFYFKIDVLHAVFLPVKMANVDNVAHDLPIFKVVGSHKRKQSALVYVRGVCYARGKRIVFARFAVALYHKFRMVGREAYRVGKFKRSCGILRVHLVGERKAVVWLGLRHIVAHNVV